MKPWFYTARSDNPYETLALEEALLETLRNDEVILFLYQHRSCVVIGRNQNAWAECRISDLQEDGALIARRISGGGAVYHDPNNLNFSFLVPRGRYDLDRQCLVLLNAVKSFGIDAAFSGRNDLVANGRKFSGSAFCFRKNAAFHHGTLLIDTDIGKMQRYLLVSDKKIRAKGVRSVEARVVNLRELCSGISPNAMHGALIESFAQIYGTPEPFEITPQLLGRAAELAERNASWDWLYGKTPRFEIEFANRFAWGSVQFLLQLRAGRVAEAMVYSDAMQPQFIEDLPAALRGRKYSGTELCAAVQALADSPEKAQMCDDLCTLIKTHVS